jgi:SulP family sulfate permease
LEDHLPPHTLVLDLKNVIYIDSTGAEALENLVRTCRKNGVRLVVAGLMGQPGDIAQRTGLLALLQERSADDVQPDVAHAIAAALAGLPEAAPDSAQMAYSGA